MYITNIKTEFYEYLAGKRFVIFAHHDIDSLCSCRILQNLIKYECVRYSLIPVKDMDQLRTSYQENQSQVNIYILINCGGTVDLIEFLDPGEEKIFFVLDSHRPTDVCNIYSDEQIRLLHGEAEDEGVPKFEDIFNDSDASDESEDESNKRARLVEADILKRRDRRLWRDKRNKLMFEYSQYTYKSKPSALVLWELCRTLAKTSKDILWWTILSIESQQILGMIESSQFVILAGEMSNQVIKVYQRSHPTTSSVVITSERDLKLPLYRHWTIDQSMQCSLIATKLKLWTRRGKQNMQQLYANMGLPLSQTRQLYSGIELMYRQEFLGTLEKCAGKFNVNNLLYPSFMAKFGYRMKYGASDMVYILLGLLEHSGFNEALECLTCPPPLTLIERGLTDIKTILEKCHTITRTAFESKKIFSAGAFLYFITQDDNIQSRLISKPFSLLLVGRFIQAAYGSQGLPLLISTPVDETNCLILGLPPLSESSAKSFFGKAFEQAAERTQSLFRPIYFDTSYCELRIADRTRFLDSLTSLLS